MVLRLVGAALLVYLLALSVGRLLRRRAGVRLGVMYQLFCVVLALYVPFLLLRIHAISGGDELQGRLPSEVIGIHRDLLAAAILLGAFFVMALLRRYLWESYFRQKRNVEIPKVLRDLTAIVIFLCAALVVLKTIYQYPIAGLLAGSGVAAAILAFAMQDLIGSILSGIAIEIGKPFKPGDWLIFETHHAEVIEVNWRSTRLRTTDDVYLDVPNKQMVGQTIINLSHPTKLHAMRFLVGVDYGAPPNRVKEVIQHATANSVGVLSRPAPKVFLKEFADSAITYEVKFWMDDHALLNDIMDAIKSNIWYALQRQKIKIPFPIRTLQIERHPGKTPGLPEHARNALRKHSILQCMDEGQTDRLFAAANLCRFGRDEKMVEQGAVGDSMFILVNGSAGVNVRHNGEPPMQVATLHGGDYFGEMSLLTGEPRTATVVAQTDCEVLEIQKPVFAEILQNNPDLLQRLSELLAQRRLETEGVLATSAERNSGLTTKEEYAAGFLTKLCSFFEL